MIREYRQGEFINLGTLANGEFVTTLPYKTGKLRILVNGSYLSESYYDSFERGGVYVIQFSNLGDLKGLRFFAFLNLEPLSFQTFKSPKHLEDFLDGWIRQIQQRRAIFSNAVSLGEADLRIQNFPDLLNLRTVAPGEVPVEDTEAGRGAETAMIKPPTISPITGLPFPRPEEEEQEEDVIIPSRSSIGYIYNGLVKDSTGRNLTDLSTLSDTALNNLFNYLYLRGPGEIDAIRLEDNTFRFADQASKISNVQIQTIGPISSFYNFAVEPYDRFDDPNFVHPSDFTPPAQTTVADPIRLSSLIKPTNSRYSIWIRSRGTTSIPGFLRPASSFFSSLFTFPSSVSQWNQFDFLNPSNLEGLWARYTASRVSSDFKQYLTSDAKRTVVETINPSINKQSNEFWTVIIPKDFAKNLHRNLRNGRFMGNLSILPQVDYHLNIKIEFDGDTQLIKNFKMTNLETSGITTFDADRQSLNTGVSLKETDLVFAFYSKGSTPSEVKVTYALESNNLYNSRGNQHLLDFDEFECYAVKVLSSEPDNPANVNVYELIPVDTVSGSVETDLHVFLLSSVVSGRLTYTNYFYTGPTRFTQRKKTFNKNLITDEFVKTILS